MPKTITIRDLPPETLAELERRAAAKGQSLQQFLFDFVLQLANRPDPEVATERRRRAAQARTSSRADA